MNIVLADHTGLLRGADVPAALGAGGHQVQLVHDGIAALRAARAWPADLVIAAVHQPRLDGLALLAALRALGGAASPAVVLTGPEADAHARTRAQELGAAAYLDLPQQGGALLQVVERVERGALGPAAQRRRSPGGRRTAG
jgi:two-component system chemotaxis response regulator CheY